MGIWTSTGAKPQPASRKRNISKACSIASLLGMPIPISERNFHIYGVSTTPTLVLIDRSGVVSLYHPGKMSYRELALHFRKLLI